MDIFVEEALRVAVLTEKSSSDFYRSAAANTLNGRGKQVLEQLANEEAEHVQEIFELHSDISIGCLMSLTEPIDGKIPFVLSEHAHETERDMTEKHALWLALDQEQACIDRYEVFVAAFREPKVRKVFEQALYMSRKHYKSLEEKFQHLTNSPWQSDPVCCQI